LHPRIDSTVTAAVDFTVTDFTVTIDSTVTDSTVTIDLTVTAPA